MFHLNPMYRYLTMHGMWFYELAFCCLSVSFFGQISGNMMIGIVVAGLLTVLVFQIEQKLLDKALRRMNLIGNGFSDLIE